MKKGDSSDTIISSTISFQLTDLLKRDILGRSLLHILAITNDVKNLSKILKLLSKLNSHHLLLINDIENSWNILHYAIYYFNFSIVKLILNSNTPILNKLLNHKDKNSLIPFDLLESLLSSFKFSNHLIYSISQNGNYKYKESTNNINKISFNHYHSTSLIISLSSGDFSNFDLSSNLFPPPSPNLLTNFKIVFLTSSSTHSALITSSGHFYITNPSKSNLSNSSSFCRIKFFDELLKRGENVVYASLTSGHTVVFTNLNKVYAFGPNIKRLNFYQNSTTSLTSSSQNYSNLNLNSNLTNSSSSFSTLLNSASSNENTKDLNSLIPLQISIKHNLPTTSNNFSNALTSLNNFNALSLSKNLDISSDLSNSFNSKFKLKGISSSNNHTIVYSDSTLHIFGLNVGQFGPLTNTIYSSNKEKKNSSNISMFAHLNWKYTDDLIDQVLALDLTTIIVSKSSLIHIYTSGLHIKVSLPFNKDIKNSWNHFKPRILSIPKKIKKIVAPIFNNNDSDKNINNSPGNLNSTYSVLILLDSGEIYLFTFPKYAISKDSFNELIKFTLLWKPSRFEMKAIDVSFGDSNLNNGIGTVLCTQSGSAFKKTKTKWTRINDVNNIKHVSIGYGFSILNNNSYDDNKCKILLLREEEFSLMHEIKPPSIIQDFGILSPLAEKLSIKESIKNDYLLNFDIDFLNNDDLKLYYSSFLKNDKFNEHDDLNDNNIEGFNKSNGLIFFKHLSPLKYKSNLQSINIFKTEESLCKALLLNKFDNKRNFEKYYDYKIKIKNTSNNLETELNVHKLFLFNRIGIKSNTYNLERKDLSFQFNEDDALIIGDIDIRSVVLFIHMLYTEETIDVWNLIENLGGFVKSGFDRLLYTFPKISFMDVIRNSFKDENSGDVIIKLSDGEIKTWKYLLSCRCDFFKQLFSKFWKFTDIVDFTNVSKATWSLLMDYILGDSNDQLFYETVERLITTSLKSIELNQSLKKKSSKFTTFSYSPSSSSSSLSLTKTIPDDEGILTDDFINIVLELIYLSNELLLPHLRELCELAIKDCINFENYDILLQHAFASGSKQLFSNCAWFIFNNLSLCYKDQRINTNIIDDSCISLLESRIHELAHIYLPNRKLAGLVEINEKNNSTKPVINNSISFIKNIDQFNGFFLHPLLWDIFGITESEISKQNVLSNKKLQILNNTNNSNTNNNNTTTTNNSISRSNSSSIQSFSDLLEAKRRLTMTLDNSVVIDDDNGADDDGFIVIQKGRRQSSTSNILKNLGSMNVSRSYSNSSLNNPINLSRKDDSSLGSNNFVKEPWKILKTLPNSDSFETQVSDNTDKVTTKPPALSTSVPIATSESTSMLDEILLQNRTNKKALMKVKSKSSAPLRISQKERKQKEREELEKTTLAANTDNNQLEKSCKSPWAVNNNVWGLNGQKVIESNSNNVNSQVTKGLVHAELNTATLLAPKKMTTAHFPSLEELKSAKKKNSIINSINQSRPIIEQKPYVITPSIVENTRSLEDIEAIKAEEEFAKWWAEESKRVQREMKQNEETQANKDSSRTDNNKKRNNGNRDGKDDRGGRGRGRGGIRGNSRGSFRGKNNK